MTRQDKWSTAVEGIPEAPFSVASTSMVGEGATPFPTCPQQGGTHFTDLGRMENWVNLVAREHVSK